VHHLLLAITFATIVMLSTIARPQNATAQTVPPAKGCACEVDDRPEPALCPQHYLPFISR
jgi:hypothetical protein